LINKDKDDDGNDDEDDVVDSDNDVDVDVVDKIESCAAMYRSYKSASG
jgi:hypothetical protein